jgi:hypothetical protein
MLDKPQTFWARIAVLLQPIACGGGNPIMMHDSEVPFGFSS